MPSLRVATGIAVFSVCILAASRSEADAPKRHPIDVSDVRRLASAQPHARQLLEEGEAALAQKDACRAAELFAKAVDEAPQSALCARRQCQALLEAGDRAEALLACRRAMAREGSPLDMRALIGALMAGRDRPTFEELNEATLLIGRAERAMPRQPWGYAAACDVARRLGDSTLLDACRKDLQRVAPDHAETRRALAGAGVGGSPALVTFGWALLFLAMMATAVDVLRRARSRRPSQLHES